MMSMDIKSEIRRCRLAMGMPATRLSVCLGLDPTYIGKIEAGKADPRLGTLRHMGAYFRDHGHPFCRPLEQLLGLRKAKVRGLVVGP